MSPSNLSWPHLAILLVVILLLFGSRKLPDAARGLGRSMRIFKSEMKEMQTDGQDPNGMQGHAPEHPELTQAQPQASAYPTGAVTGHNSPQGMQQPVEGRPPAPQPVWDPNTQQYVLPNQQQPPHER